MKTVATIAAIAGVTMASGIEEFEDHSFALRRPTLSATALKHNELHNAHNFGILPPIHHHADRAIAHDDIADDHFAVEDLADESLFSLFGKKKPQPQPQSWSVQQPTNPDDIVDIGDIHVDLNSDEFFQWEDFMSRKLQPQLMQPQPRRIRSNKFFAEKLGDDNFSIFSKLFHKKKNPPHDPSEFQPREIPSNEFFAEELGDDNFSIFSKLFHKKKNPPHDPSEFQPREIPSNEFFSLKDLFHHKKKPNQQQQQPQKPTNPDDIVDIGDIHVDLNSNEFFAEEIADDNFSIFSKLFHKKKNPPHDPSEFQPREIPSNEFFAEELGDDNLSIFSKLFHKKKNPPHDPSEFQPREIPSNEFFSLKDLFHHKKKPNQQQQQPQGPVEIPSDEFIALSDIALDLGRRAKVRAEVPVKPLRADGKGSLHHLSHLLNEAH